MTKKLFPTNLPELEWQEFAAEGFSEPVAGLIHRTSKPAVCGMPIGGIDTGCLDLETDGTFGYCTIFNSLVPRRGPLNLPFLGLSVGPETWVLSSRKIEGTPYPGILKYRRAQSAQEIHYWGHYPVADLEFETDAPVSVGLRAWAPFIPGDVAISNTPGAVFEVRLRNTGAATQKGAVVFSFSGPSPQESCGSTEFSHTKVNGNFSGVVVTNKSNVGYALGVTGKESFSIGGDLGIDGGAWSRSKVVDGPWYGIEKGLPLEAGQAGASIMVDFKLNEKEKTTVRFILAWYSPQWKGGGTPMAGGNTYTHMYAARYRNALEVAQLLADQHQPLLKRILAWQQAIYEEKGLPVWLRESLINVLHVITEDGLWAQAKPPIGDWCRPEDGLFGMNECPRCCPQMECIPCSMLGNLPLVYFFPELALSTLRTYKAYQYPDGQAPWIFGGCTSVPPTPPCELATPARGFKPKPQKTLDGPCYVDMVERFWLCTGNSEILKEFYESVKKNTAFTMNLRPESGPAGIISMPSGNDGSDWYESTSFFGMVAHVGGVHLANLRMAERIAEEIGDKEFARQCRDWFKQGSEVLEEKMWAGDHYLIYNEPETGKRSKVIMGYQLDGEWMARFHGLEGIFRPERVKKTLATLKKEVVTKRGAITFRLKPGDDFDPGYWTNSGVHIPASLMLAMLYIYYGERKFGLELARKTVYTLIVENRCSWDSAILINAETGQRLYGNDYYQNLIFWALPAVLANQDLTGPCRPEGLAAKVLEAGRDMGQRGLAE